MKPTIETSESNAARAGTSEEILILTDGRILAHNLTPVMAAVLRQLNPNDEPMRQRAMTDGERERSHELRERS
jgi:hypothetical protein